MSMFKSKPEFRRMPQVQQTYDLEETIGVASRKKYLEDMKMRMKEAENRGKNIRHRNDWLQHQKKSLYPGELDNVSRQLERPMMIQNKTRTTKETTRIKRYNGGNKFKSIIIIMIKTLKSELILRPTYDELIGLINQQGDENRPPIENIIDRRATLFRNNQFGSQFDNVDFLGLKTQEEDKVKEELRQTQLRQTAMATGSSMGILSYGGRTPVGVYNADGFETPDSDYRMTAEQINRIRAELELGARRQQESQQASSSSARSDLSDVTSQSLPAGTPIHSMVTDDEEDASADASRGSRDELPPLETPTEVAEEEEEEDDDDETQLPPQSRKHKETIDYNENIDRWKNKDVSVGDILYQLHLGGIQLTEEQKEEMDKLKTKGKGKTPTKKDY